jgi:hypothetical protein
MVQHGDLWQSRKAAYPPLEDVALSGQSSVPAGVAILA